MASQSEPGRELTAKGVATRARIVDAAATLFYERGIGRTTNNDIREAARVSGSQLNHYFPSRAALVAAVLRQRVDNAVDPALFPGTGMPHSFATLRGWADTHVARHETLTGGCRVGSLAGEALKSSLDLREQIAEGYERWRAALRDGLLVMKQDGELSDAADVDYLSLVLLSSLQGGLLLTQAAGSTRPLRAALDAAISVVAGYAAQRH